MLISKWLYTYTWSHMQILGLSQNSHFDQEHNFTCTAVTYLSHRVCFEPILEVSQVVITNTTCILTKTKP